MGVDNNVELLGALEQHACFLIPFVVKMFIKEFLEKKVDPKYIISYFKKPLSDKFCKFEMFHEYALSLDDSHLLKSKLLKKLLKYKGHIKLSFTEIISISEKNPDLV